MNITISASKTDELVSGNTQVIQIICDEESYEKALELIKEFTKISRA